MTMTWMKRVTASVLMVGLLATAQPASAQGGMVSRVQADSSDTWRVWAPAGWHEVTVIGDGDTDLDLYVEDAFGRRLATDDDLTDRCIGSFYMAQGGYIQIRIRNLGDVYNEYQINVR